MTTSSPLTARQLLLPSSWQWPLLALCMLVLVHLLLSFAAHFFRDFLVFGLLPILLLIGFYLGWKAREFVGMDVLLAAVVYLFVLDNLFQLGVTFPWRWQVVWAYGLPYILAGLVAYTGALAGSWWRQKHLS